MIAKHRMAACMFVLLIAQSAYAQDSAGEMEFKDIAETLRCPTCQGLSVLESDAPFSNQIKDLVREKMKEGLSESEIQSFFVQRYGPWILREPPKEGFHLTAWIIPLLLMTVGPLLMWYLVWQRKPETSPTHIRSDESILAEMEQRLGEMKKEIAH